MSVERLATADIGRLSESLTKCGLKGAKLHRAVHRLTDIPASLHESMRTIRPHAWGQFPAQLSFNSAPDSFAPSGRDLAAQFLYLNSGRVDPSAKWQQLTPAERKRARRLWIQAFGVPLHFDPPKRGKPTEIDSALVLYLMRILEEECGSKFRFSRPVNGGRPNGPIWRALAAALTLAAETRKQGHRWSGENIADIIKASRSKRFAKLSTDLELGLDADSVASDPALIRWAISRVRVGRRRARRP